jgi:hypothetical protein
MLWATSQAFYDLYMPVGYKLNLLPLQSKRILSASRDSTVGIATRYGLDGTGIESFWR